MKAIAFVVAGTLFLTNAVAAEEPASSPAAVAIVNGKVLTAKDIDSAFRRSRVSRQELTDEQRRLYRSHVLATLVNEVLISQHLDDLKIPVDDPKIDEHIAKLRQKLAANGRTLRQLLTEANIDEPTMRQEIGDVLRWLGYVETQATDEVLRSYFQANREAFDGTLVRVSHVLKKVAPEASAAERRRARQQIEALRIQLAGGTSFESLARTHSDCPSREVGGDLDYFPRKGVMSESFAAAAFSLRVGEISEVVETEFGYHLILVTDRKPGRPISYEQVVDEVKKRLCRRFTQRFGRSSAPNCRYPDPSVSAQEHKPGRSDFDFALGGRLGYGDWPAPSR